MLSPIVLVFALSAPQAAALHAAASGCADPVSLDAAGAEACRAQEQIRLADSAAKDSRERVQHLQEAATHYRRSVTLTTSADVKARALAGLVDLYDRARLDDLQQMELTVRERLALLPTDLAPVFKLAKAQEDEGLIDRAESTLLDIRRQQPEEIDPYRMLAQFYARRATAISLRDKPAVPPTRPGEPDEQGIYLIGGGVDAPHRQGVAIYPKDAQAAGISGNVQAEVVIDASGNVTDARVVRSVPLLDQAALDAVRQWKFDPAIVNGQPVPVRMTVTINFTTR